MELPVCGSFSWFALKEITKKGSYIDCGGNSFNYLVTYDISLLIQQYLAKLQMVDMLVGMHGKKNEELDDFCI